MCVLFDNFAVMKLTYTMKRPLFSFGIPVVEKFGEDSFAYKRHEKRAAGTLMDAELNNSLCPAI